MTVVARKAWGARAPKRAFQAIKKPVPLVFIHHEAAVYNETDQASDYAEARQIQAYGR